MRTESESPTPARTRPRSSATGRWLAHVGLHPDFGRIQQWCELHIPSLSRRFFKWGRDYPLGLAFGFLALSAFGRWWEYTHGLGSATGAAFWTTAAVALLFLAKRWWFVAVFAPGWIAAQSYFHFLLEAKTSYLLVGTASLAAVLLILALGWWLGPPWPSE